MAEFSLESSISGGRKKLLYVDDMQYSLISFKKGLEKYFEIYLAESAEHMYKILENIKPDLILLDVNMPETDGYETIKELKADKRYSEIPVIFLTSSISRENVIKGLSLGASDYIIKPFNALKLMESIEAHINPEKNTKKNIEKNKATPNILVVDDVTSMLRTIHFALHDKCNVSLLSRSEVVIDFLLSNKQDLILLDHLMPGLSGFELIPMIRALPDYRDIPIIIITTEGTIKNVNEAVLRGASDFIVKPFDPKELNYKIDRQIRLTREIKEKAENESGGFP